ncbi:phosphotransferase family protein [Arcicella sp. LKC2W]|uniref:phosphotransferase family protein n=1 Tax=Arcicella sp. LKC2W TaxID=2984198 RepID=UPI002B213FF0|nr:phosphotransferase family protein [Arcicella sp. LKC2W]MEA5459990.1 phosphotransferase family protein [Arcicella sp. LKC2W]
MSDINIDKSTQIRQGEELNQDQLNEYLKAQIPDFGQILGIEQFAGGFSNLTYLIKTAEKEYVLRRPPFGVNIKSAHDMEREFKVLSLLKPHYPRVPQAVIFCKDVSVMGCQFYVMERVNGVIFRGKDALKMRISETTMRKISENLIDNLVDLHLLDIEKTGLINLGKPEGYVQRQVEGWIGRYEKSLTDDIPAMIEIADWMRANMPRPQAPAFLHNDYKYDNVLLNPDNLTEILGVLDWEMSTVGDPLMDLGASLAYWCEDGDGQFLKSFNITWLNGNLNRKEVVERYAQKTNRDVTDILFYYVFGLYKNTVIMQQIYARWKAGLTKDPRFGGLILGIQELSKMAIQAIKRGDL